MRKILLICVAPILATGIAYSATPCDGFEIKIKNNSSDDLSVSKIELQGAEIVPGSIQTLYAHTIQAFTVNKSSEAKKMLGYFDLHSAKSKKVNLKFKLINKKFYCEHTDTGSSSDYPLDKSRMPGNVTYTID